MRLRRIVVREFRRFGAPVCIDGLGDGLTIVSGDNEEGKSTLLTALKAALFDRAALTGEVRDTYAPAGGGTPAVEVTFESDGKSCRLEKVFKKQGCTLTIDGQRLAGDAAEDRLRQLLRFARPERGHAQPHHHGLQAVFWVDQGTTFAGFDRLAIGRDRFAAAMEAEVGSVALGPRALGLYEDALEARRRLVTEKRQEPSGAWAEAEKVVDREAKALAATRERALAVTGKIEAVAKARADLARFLREDRLKVALEREALTRMEALAAQRWAAERDRLADVWKTAAARAVPLETHVKQRGDWRSTLAAADRDLPTPEANAADLAALTEGAMALRLAELAEAEARGAVVQAQAARDNGQRAVQWQVRAQRLSQLEGLLTAAADERATASEAKAALAANPCTPAVLNELDGLQLAVASGRTRLEVVATELELVPNGAAAVLLGGRELTPGSTHRLTERSDLWVEGYGRMIVHPGAEDLARRRQALREAEAALAAGLSRLGFADVTGAREAGAARASAVAVLALAESSLSRLLQQNGAQRWEEVEARRNELVAAQAAKPECPAAIPDEATHDALAEAFTRADRRLVEAGINVRTADQRLNALKVQRANEDGRQVELGRQRQAVQALLDAAVAGQPDADLATAAELASARIQQAHAALQAHEAKAPERDIDSLSEAATLAARAVLDLKAEQRRLEAAVTDLGNELKGLAADGVSEDVVRLEGSLATAIVQRDRWAGEARAWGQLVRAMEEVRTATRAALTRPVLGRLLPRLREVFPSAEVELDEAGLSVKALRRDGQALPLESLSLGTREQLAILVRLALAELMLDGPEGEAPCLILDDALVYADPGRLETMKVILQRAAARLQIIVLTCRPLDYAGLDARRLRLEDCRS